MTITPSRPPAAAEATPSVEDCMVGDRLPGLTRTITRPALVRYAGASGDFNPIHFDDDIARESGLDGVIGHGMFAMGLVSEAVTDWLGDSGLLQSLSVRFARPSRLGDRLLVSGEVVRRTVDEDGRVRLGLSVACRNQDGADIVTNATATVLSPARD
jgi:acyl dehydratase